MKVRSVKDGRIGTLVETTRGGKVEQRVRLEGDALSERLVSYLEKDWVSVTFARPLSPAHIAEICHAGDQMLCRRTGLKLPKGWLDLSEDEKRTWIEKGPDDVEIRAKLYKAMRAVLKELGE